MHALRSRARRVPPSHRNPARSLQESKLNFAAELARHAAEGDKDGKDGQRVHTVLVEGSAKEDSGSIGPPRTDRMTAVAKYNVGDDWGGTSQEEL